MSDARATVRDMTVRDMTVRDMTVRDMTVRDMTVRDMTTAITLRGIELRYVLTHFLHHRDYPATISELAEELESRGFAVDGRASKAISDALRWECRHGRVCRRGRGRYGPASMPRSTEYRIHDRVMALRSRAAALTS